MSKLPELTPIKSSMFAGQHYEPNTRKLTVQFTNGAVHEYDDVPMDKYETFIAGASPGRFFNDRIKPNHIGRKVSE